MFADRYVRSVNSSNLKDDELHHSTDALGAAAIADLKGCGFGALLCRAKYGHGVVHKSFESGARTLAELVSIWYSEVEKRGKQRQWIKPPKTAWDAQAAIGLYRAVAEKSLAYWLGGHCEACKGAGAINEAIVCHECSGTGKQEIKGSSYLETECIKDMVSELQGIFDSHSARASREMRVIEKVGNP